MRRKAQAAMEFLMTYGWAILVVLIAIGALMYFIKPTEMIPEKCTLPTGSGIFCEQWGADSVGSEITLLIKNSMTEPLYVSTTSFIENDDGDRCYANVDSDLVGYTNPSDVSVQLPKEGTATVVFGRDGLADEDAADTCYGAATDLIVAGEKLQGQVSLNFTDEISLGADSAPGGAGADADSLVGFAKVTAGQLIVKIP